MMELKYRKPEEMKDSGVEWIGLIPKEWECRKFKYIFTYEKGRTPKIFSGPNSSTIPYINTEYLRTGIANSFVKSHTGLLKIFDGDILLLWDGANAGEFFTGKEGVLGSTFVRLRLIDHDLFFRYVKYGTDSSEKFLRESTYGMGIPHVDSTILTNMLFAIPGTIDEQQKIANFLDIKTAEFDSIISKKEQLIEELEEAKKSLISEVVTGKVKIVNGEMVKRQSEDMKESGVEWVGMMPRVWSLTKIKFNTYVKGRIGWQGLRADEFIDSGPYLVTGTDFQNGQIAWDDCYHISEKRFREAPSIHLREGDLLVTKDGTIGKMAIVNNCPAKAILNSGIFVTRPLKNKYLVKYMYYVLSSKMFSLYIELSSTGSTIQHLYQETFNNFCFCLAPLKEQMIIIDFLDSRIKRLDFIILKNRTQIDKLKEAKQSLIFEAVTGKIDLRDWKILEEEVLP